MTKSLTSPLTPKQYLAVRAEQEAVIQEAEQRIFEAREAFKNYQPSGAMRPATADDIKEQVIIWFPRASGDGWTPSLASGSLGDGEYLNEFGFACSYNGAFLEINK